MKDSNRQVKRRLKIALTLTSVLVIVLILRLGNIQILRKQELKKGALEQWTKSVAIRPKRGTIYDRKGKKLAISVNSFTVWATPKEIKESRDTAKVLASVLKLDEEDIFKKIDNNESIQKIKQWITREEVNELKSKKLKGITLAEDNKRFYPNDNFASYILGFTDIDNNGLDGVEYMYNDYLSGIPGRWMKMTDAGNRQLPYDGERVHDPEDGSSLVLTIDETIQQFAENAAQKALVENKAKNVSVVMMDVKTGEVLAMVNKPDFDPNNPREPLNKELKKEWEKLPSDELQNKWYELWRNFTINDIYEPGSTFKVITAAAALEENSADLDTNYYCNGFVRDIKGVVIKCARWYNPHKEQTFREAMNNSCNVAFVDMGRQLGKENLYKYIKAFGFGEKTGIDLLGEQDGIIPSSSENIPEVKLATLSYGHGIAVTPMQLVSAISAIANEGELLKPKIVKQVLDIEGEIIKEFDTEIVRKVISKETSQKVLSIMETVVSDGSGANAYIPGYKIGGKTGTAQKVIDGAYAKDKYIGSFVAVAPIDDPKIAMLVVVDEPKDTYYGGSVAAPAAREILQKTFNYLDIAPNYTKEEEKISEVIEVPDVKNQTIGDAGKILSELDLRHHTEFLELTNESVVLEQYPSAGEVVKKGSIIDLYFDFKANEEIIIPPLDGKTRNQVIKELEELSLKYDLKGEGNAFEQIPKSGERVRLDTEITVKFK